MYLQDPNIARRSVTALMSSHSVLYCILSGLEVRIVHGSQLTDFGVTTLSSISFGHLERGKKESLRVNMILIDFSERYILPGGDGRVEVKIMCRGEVMVGVGGEGVLEHILKVT